MIEYLFYLGLSVLFIYAEPMIELKRFLEFKEEEYMNYGKVKQWLHKLIHCLFCSSFWITLIISFNFELSVIVSLLAYILENKLK